MHVLLCSMHSSITGGRAVGASWHGGCCLFLHWEVLGNKVTVLDDLNHRVEQEKQAKNLKPSPLPGASNVGGKNSTGRVAERTRTNPKMRRGLSGLPVCWKVEEHERTRGFRVVQATGA
jgi:hypothetical protein